MLQHTKGFKRGGTFKSFLWRHFGYGVKIVSRDGHNMNGACKKTLTWAVANVSTTQNTKAPTGAAMLATMLAAFQGLGFKVMNLVSIVQSNFHIVFNV